MPRSRCPCRRPSPPVRTAMSSCTLRLSRPQRPWISATFHSDIPLSN